MTLHQCPRCNQVFSSMPGAGNSDFEHNCNSGNPTLDNEDVFKLANSQNWNLQGVTNRLSPIAKIHGAKFNGVTARGYKAPLYTQDKHQEFIQLNKEEK